VRSTRIHTRRFCTPTWDFELPVGDVATAANGIFGGLVAILAVAVGAGLALRIARGIKSMF
jgi:hypothetical protein